MIEDRLKKEIIEWLKAVVLAFALFFILNIFISTTTVYSTSMYSTLIEGDRLILLKHADIKRGDIVSFKSDMTLTQYDIASLNFIQRLTVNEETTKNLIKRVIGLPGEKIDIVNGQVYIDGKKLEEDYLNTISGETLHFGVLGKDMYFMMGDNRGVSLDSRQLGPVHSSKLIGKSIFRFYPFERIGTVH